MSKSKKPSAPGSRDPQRRDGSWQPLSEAEVEISLICLKYFRGEWDTYLDFLRGPRVSNVQKLREAPLVEQLKERDQQTDYLTNLLEDEVVNIAESLPFDGLLRLWELCLLLNPESEPFPDRPEQVAGEASQAAPADDGSHTLH